MPGGAWFHVGSMGLRSSDCAGRQLNWAGGTAGDSTLSADHPLENSCTELADDPEWERLIQRASRITPAPHFLPTLPCTRDGFGALRTRFANHTLAL